LAAIRDSRVVIRPNDTEIAPEPDPIDSIEPAFDQQSIAQGGWPAVIDLGPDYNGIPVRLRHLAQSESELLRQKRSRDFNKPQVGDIVDDTTAIGVEEHHLHFRLDAKTVYLHGRESSIRAGLSMMNVV